MKPKIVFYQQYAVPYFGILSLAARLRNAGFKTDVVIQSLEKHPVDLLKRMDAKIIGISVLSTEHDWLIDTVKAMRREIPDAIIIIGGMHAILYPEEILSQTAADIVCHSEGEEVLLKTIAELDKPEPKWDSIEGLSYRDDKGVIRATRRAALVQFDDKIVEDRSIYYDRYPALSRDIVHRFFSSRGCPYKCSFCYNSKVQELFSEKGVYVRRKSVKNFIKEITLQCSKYPIKSIFFYDDLFTCDKIWLNKFLEIYRKEINIPFMCTTRADIVDENLAGMLASAGCRTASFGIETGAYGIRKDILKKNISDEQIIRCGCLLKREGINVQTSNMFCIPGETLDDAYKTIELNIKANADFVFSALLMPFPKTEIAEYCIKNNYLKPDYSLKDIRPSFLNSSILDMPDKNAIINVHRLAYFFVRYPLFYKICRKIVRFSFLGIFFSFVFMLSNLIRHKQERGITLFSALRYGWRMRRSF